MTSDFVFPGQKKKKKKKGNFDATLDFLICWPKQMTVSE